MLGKLKELGNGILGKFGMSLDNFKARMRWTRIPNPQPHRHPPPSTLHPHPHP